MVRSHPMARKIPVSALSLSAVASIATLTCAFKAEEFRYCEVLTLGSKYR